MKIYNKPLVITFFIILFVLLVTLGQSFIFEKTMQSGIAVNQNVTTSFIHNNSKINIVFFGYVGCRYVCTPDLQEIAAWYASKEMDTYRDQTEVLFVNIKSEINTSQAQLFAQSFHPEFQGITLSKKELLNLDRAFGVYFSDDLSNKGELNHTDNLYLLNRTNLKNDILNLVKIYSLHPLQKQELTKNIQLLIESD